MIFDFFNFEIRLTKKLNRLECRRSGLKSRKLLMEQMYNSTGSMSGYHYREYLNIGEELGSLDTEIGHIKFELDDRIMKTMGVKAPAKGDKHAH